jgi:hypothetical protein
LVATEEEPSSTARYYPGGFSCGRQPLDILRSFLLYNIRAESCQHRFDGVHYVSNNLRLAWTCTVEIDMAFWCAFNKHTYTRQSNKQTKMEDCFRSIWCHLDIFSSGDGAISRCLFPSLYFLELGAQFVVMGLLPSNPFEVPSMIVIERALLSVCQIGF